VAADRGRAKQFPATGFLLNAGVPDDGKQADQSHDDGDEPGPPDDELAEAGAGQTPVERNEHRVVGVLQTFRRCGENLAEGGWKAEHHEAEEPDPQRQEQPVPTQDQPDKLAGAGQHRHRDTSARGSPAAAVCR
jgi:hypothetical protein